MRPKLLNDKSMIEDGVMLINKGIKLGTYAIDILDNETSTNNDNELGCYMIVQSIELLIKGIIHCFGEETPDNHALKPITKQLNDIYTHRVPELSQISISLDDFINDTHFTYVLYSWQADGRYKHLNINQSYVGKAINIYNDLVRFSRNYQLTEVKEKYDFFE